MAQGKLQTTDNSRVLREFLFEELEDNRDENTRDRANDLRPDKFRAEKLRAAAFQDSHEQELERWDGLS